MIRCPSLFRGLAVLVTSVTLACCTPASNDATRQSSSSHANPPPRNLPQDFIEDSAPKPPPNHDGGLERDAGRNFDTAVPFKEAVRDGRIAEDDDGDAWVLEGPAGHVLSVNIYNLSDDTILAYELLDQNERAVIFPRPDVLYAEESIQHTIEIPRGESDTKLLLMITAADPLTYEIRTEIL